MRLDRNENIDGMGKYALINLRRLSMCTGLVLDRALAAYGDLRSLNLLDEGIRGEDDEFFVIKIKDKFAEPALSAYANAAAESDPEWAKEVTALATRAAHHPNKKQPD
jgi:hypothetical protein